MLRPSPTLHRAVSYPSKPDVSDLIVNLVGNPLASPRKAVNQLLQVCLVKRLRRVGFQVGRVFVF